LSAFFAVFLFIEAMYFSSALNSQRGKNLTEFSLYLSASSLQDIFIGGKNKKLSNINEFLAGKVDFQDQHCPFIIGSSIEGSLTWHNLINKSS
jgi:hypothetical protein